MSRPRRPEYDAPAFREMWFSGVPVAEIARKMNVTPTAISCAARYRGYPTKWKARRAKMNEREARFLAAFNETVEAANRRPEGADHLGICNRLAHEYGIAPRRATEIIVANITDVAGTG